MWLTAVGFIAAFYLASVIVFSNSEKKGRYRTDDVGISLLGALVNQGTSEERLVSQTVSMRAVFWLAFVFGFLGVNFLSANLTSAMSVKRERREINTIFDLAANDFKLFVLGGSTLENLFSLSPMNTPHRQLWEDHMKHDLKYRPLMLNVRL